MVNRSLITQLNTEGLNQKEIAASLGISHQRVSQVLLGIKLGHPPYLKSRKKYGLSQKRRKAQKRYEGSEKGRATLVKYQTSSKFKDALKRYYRSEEGQEAHRRAKAKRVSN